jgi:hypothetical protein
MEHAFGMDFATLSFREGDKCAFRDDITGA